MENYPSNSRKLRDEEPEKREAERKIEKVITGEVVRRKKPLGRRIAETFGGGDAGGVWEYVARDVLIPAIKETVTDAITQGVEQLIFGEVRGGRRRAARSSNSGYSSYTSYNRYATPPRRDPRERDVPSRRDIEPAARASHDFEQIVLESRVEAETVRQELFDILSQYDTVCIRDLYDLVGITPTWADEKWGWTDLRGTDIVRARGGGYMIVLPRPEPLR